MKSSICRHLGLDGFEGGLTTRKYQALTKVSRATAFREISELVQKKMLIQNVGKGRNVSYRINQDNLNNLNSETIDSNPNPNTNLFGKLKP